MIDWKIEFKRSESGVIKHYEGFILDKVLQNGWTVYLVNTNDGELRIVSPTEITKILVRK